MSLNEKYQAGIPVLREHSVVTHGDLDQLNVLWDSTDQPTLIDWESARNLNPTFEIVRASLAWSGISTEGLSTAIYTRMLQTYTNSGGILNTNHLSPALYRMFGSLINWLLYNIQISCCGDNQEQKDTAIKEVNVVLKTSLRLKSYIPELLEISEIK